MFKLYSLTSRDRTGFILEMINSTGGQLAMNDRINPAYEYYDKPASLEFIHLKGNTNQRGESGHSNHDHCKRYEVNHGEAKPAQGLIRTILAIIVCLISLLALLLTILMLVGKIGPSNEG